MGGRGVIFATTLPHFHYFISLETVNIQKSEVFHLLISLGNANASVVTFRYPQIQNFSFRKEILEAFCSVLIQDFNQKFFYNTFGKEQSHQLCLFLLVSQRIIHKIYFLADIDCTVLIRGIYISSSRTIISILQNQCEICLKLTIKRRKVVLVSSLITLSRLHTLFLLLLLTLSITCWVHIVKSLII